MSTNHKPLVTGTDEGIWRRLRLVPFEVVIPLSQQDKTLGDRLKMEAEAVLAWLVGGYHDWRTQGLAEPDAVVEATAGYQAESDAIRRFLTQRCVVGPTFRVRSSNLYEVWSAWCNTEGEQPGTNKAFTTALQNKGFDTKRTNVGAMWQGIGLASDRDG